MDFPRFEACAAQVNIPLFNAAIQLAVSTTEASKRISDLYAQMDHMIWYEHQSGAPTFDLGGIRYFGELLERYGERLGDTLPNLRAVALAVAWTVPIQTDSMFVGKQRENFLQAVRKAAESDIYLTGALYRMAKEDDEKERLRGSLLRWKYSRTEEILFALCALDGCTEAFLSLRPHLVNLLGSGRTISVEGNSGLLAWFLTRHREDILACRKKDNAALRALVRLTEAYVRPTDRAWDVLRAAGYLPNDILTANSMFVWDRRLNRTGLSAGSIPAEKLATAYVVYHLNGKALPSQTALDYILWLLKKYNHFTVKYEGNEGLWQAVKPQLHLCCPEIVAWMVRSELEYDYRVDVLDGKWDRLATLLPPGRYHEIFRCQLTGQPEPEKETTLRMLERYRSLTGVDYAEVFKDYSFLEEGAFSLLVSLGILELWPFFEAHKDNVPEGRYLWTPLHYVWDAVSDVKNQYAFSFWRRFFDDYTPADVPRFWSGEKFHHSFIHFYSYSPSIDYLRPALTREENRQLYEWIDQSVFTLDVKRYNDLVLAFLKDEATQTPFDLDELRPIFDQLLLLEPNSAAVRNLKSRYLTEAELADERSAREHADRERKEAEKKRIIQEVGETLTNRYDGSFRSLYDGLKSFPSWDHRRKYAAHILIDRLPGLLEGHKPISTMDFGYLLSLCGRLVGYGLMDTPAAMTLLQVIAVDYTNEQKEAAAC